jgi:hypothetical protein
MKTIIPTLGLVLGLYVASCNDTPSQATLKAQHDYDSIKEHNRILMRCLDCQQDLILRGVNADTAQKECEAIYGK